MPPKKARLPQKKKSKRKEEASRSSDSPRREEPLKKVQITGASTVPALNRPHKQKAASEEEEGQRT